MVGTTMKTTGKSKTAIDCKNNCLKIEKTEKKKKIEELKKQKLRSLN